ncbi:MAG: hypothetical protein PW791_06075 [Neorhizobium sp.]|nr:hypothetical protein [Neorhizobium sp.]
MKGSLGTSLVVHVVVLVLAMVSLSAPKPLDVAQEEVLPVDLVPVEELTQMQQGDKKAQPAPKPSTKPTKNTKIVDKAENAGDNDVDLKTPPTPVKKPTPVETAAAPKPTERPTPTPTEEQNQVKDVAKEETAPKPQEQAALPTPKPPEPTPPKPTPTPPKPEPTPPKPEAAKPAPSPIQAENKSDTGEIPDTPPIPAQRPTPPKPETPKPVEEAKPVEKPAEKKPDPPKPTETAKAQDKATEKPTNKKVADKKQEVAKASSSKQSDFNADQISTLLNKEQAAGGGAKRSTSPAATGSTKPANAAKLSQSELDALRGQIENNWSVIAGIDGADGVVIRVTMKLDQSGAIIGRPEVTASGGSDAARRTLEGSALRAVMRSSPFKNLPADKYDAWSEVVVNFDPSELL